MKESKRVLRNVLRQFDLCWPPNIGGEHEEITSDELLVMRAVPKKHRLKARSQENRKIPAVLRNMVLVCLQAFCFFFWAHLEDI